VADGPRGEGARKSKIHPPAVRSARVTVSN
jgi:hypothetical protein